MDDDDGGRIHFKFDITIFGHILYKIHFVEYILSTINFIKFFR